MKRFLHLLTGICTLALALQACTKSPAENPGRTDDPGNDEQNSKVTLTLSTPRTRTTAKPTSTGAKRILYKSTARICP